MNENQLGVLLEEIRDKFNVLAEGQQILLQDVSGLKQDVSGLKQDVKRLELKLDSVFQYTAHMAEKITGHEIRIVTLEKAANI